MGLGGGNFPFAISSKRPPDNPDIDDGGAQSMMTKPKAPTCHIEISLRLMRYPPGMIISILIH